MLIFFTLFFIFYCRDCLFFLARSFRLNCSFILARFSAILRFGSLSFQWSIGLFSFSFHDLLITSRPPCFRDLWKFNVPFSLSTLIPFLCQFFWSSKGGWWSRRLSHIFYGCGHVWGTSGNPTSAHSRLKCQYLCKMSHSGSYQYLQRVLPHSFANYICTTYRIRFGVYTAPLWEIRAERWLGFSWNKNK
jgi:hypothetical protein